MLEMGRKTPRLSSAGFCVAPRGPTASKRVGRRLRLWACGFGSFKAFSLLVEGSPASKARSLSSEAIGQLIPARISLYLPTCLLISLSTYLPIYLSNLSIYLSTSVV